eukprot:PhF_6_TR29297/c0_g1_i2/m.42955
MPSRGVNGLCMCFLYHSVRFITFPAATALATHGVHEEQGTLIGSLSSVKGLTTVVGPLLMGVMYNRCKEPPLSFPQAPMLFGALCVAIALACAWWYLKDDGYGRGNDGVESGSTGSPSGGGGGVYSELSVGDGVGPVIMDSDSFHTTSHHGHASSNEKEMKAVDTNFTQ